MEPRERHHFGYSEIDEQGIHAVRKWYEHLGMDCIDEKWESASGGFDLVERAGDEIAFVTVYAKRYRMPDIHEIGIVTRRSMETRAIAWIDAHPSIERARISFDIAYVTIIGESRALLRLHRDVLKTVDGDRPNGDYMTYEDIIGSLSTEGLDEMLDDDVVLAAKAQLKTDPPFDTE